MFSWMKSLLTRGHGPVASAGASQPTSDPFHWLLRAIGARTDAGVFVSETTALNLPAVYACVNRVANPIAMFPLGVYREQDGESVPDRAHRLNVILRRRPNPLMNVRTLKKLGQTYALLWGNGYLEIQRNNRGEPVHLWPLLPWSTQAKRVEDGADMSRKVVETQIGGRTFTLDDYDVIHLMDLSLDGCTGLSQIAQARAAVGLGLAAERFGGKFFANDAKSGGFLQHPGKLSERAKKNIADDLSGPPAGERDGSERTQGGLDHAHRVKVLEEGMKYISTTIPPEDAQFLGTREFQVSEIARMYNVPLFLLQSNERDTSWGTGLEQMMIAFVAHTLEPWAEAWEQELNWKLFTEEERDAGYFVKFNMAALLRGDMAARAAFYQSGITDGWLGRDEARAKEDLPRRPGLDRMLYQANLAVVGEARDDEEDRSDAA